MSLNHLDIDEENVYVGENGSVDLDLVSGQGNEKLDSWIYHLKLHINM